MSLQGQLLAGTGDRDTLLRELNEAMETAPSTPVSITAANKFDSNTTQQQQQQQQQLSSVPLQHLNGSTN
eukprot:19183-Heterococcus_DN1.PRE.7